MQVQNLKGVPGSGDPGKIYTLSPKADWCQNSFLLGGGSVFCSTKTFNILNETHPNYGR